MTAISDKQAIEKARKIKLLICDVDGVLSDGKITFSNNGDELKSFNTKDGQGIKLLQQSDIHVAIITGRQSNIVEHRAKELGIQFIFQGHSDKKAAYQSILNTLSLKPEQVAHVGDDLPDLPLMKMSGLGFSVNDAHFFVKQHADWVTTRNGGDGAVREIADFILKSQNKLDTILSSYL